MANPYTWAFSNPELIPAYAAFGLLFVGWAYWSGRKLFKWGISIQSGVDRGEILPPDDVTNEILLFCVVVAVNLLLVGAYLYVVA